MKALTTNRSEKIKLLQGIKEGKISIDVLQGGRFYCFITYTNNPGIYFLEGKAYNEVEYQAFCKQINEANNGSIIWNEGKDYGNKILEIEVVLNNDKGGNHA